MERKWDLHWVSLWLATVDKTISRIRQLDSVLLDWECRGHNKVNEHVLGIK